MPCNCNHMQANQKEKLLSQIACLLDELNGKETLNADHWRGYHPRVYNNTMEGDKLISELCSRIKNLKKDDLSNYSLELQIWWREHQKHDEERLERERRGWEEQI